MEATPEMPANGFKFGIRQSGISVHEAVDKDIQSNLYAIGLCSLAAQLIVQKGSFSRNRARQPALIG